MDYRHRLAQIENLTMENIIADCKHNVPSKFQRYPYSHPDLNHGLDLLSNDEALDCYMAAYGEIHHSKCRAVLQNMPFPPKNNPYSSLSLEIVDWGCGQGIGSISVIDFLKERELTQWLKKVTLIEPSKASLDRATANVAKSTNNGVRIVSINEYLPAVESDDMIDGISFEQGFVIHMLSNILDVSQIDLGKLAKCLAIPGHIHYVLCVGPLNANAFRMDRFCNIFHPQSYFSNISSKSYGRTSDTNYCYTCKTKGFLYDGATLDLSQYNPHEKANKPIYDEYNVNLHVQNKLLSSDEGWVYYHLQRIITPVDILYVKPNINGTLPDFIILRPHVGIMIVSVFEENITNCTTDNSGLISIIRSDGSHQLIESPYSSLDTSQNLIIEGITEFTEAVIDDNRNLSLVKKVLICTKGSREQCLKLFGEPSFTTVYGANFIQDPSVSSGLFNDVRFYYQTKYFDDIVLGRLKRTLSPQWHTFREGQELKLSSSQKSLSISIAGAQRKISGVAGAGKTQVLATRAVNAQIRTGGEILLLTFNITLVNYMRMRIGKIRADFPWDKIQIDYYHRFFRKYSNDNNLHVHRESYNNIDFFKSVAANLPKYDAILIDEVQDYQTNWLQILKQYFLKPGGEFVVFGDPKQNIYHRELDTEGNVKLGIIPGTWNKELSKGHRFSNPSLVNLAVDFQRTFQKVPDTIDTTSISNNRDSRFQFNLLQYKYFNHPNEDNQPDIFDQVYEIIMTFITKNGFDHKDIAVLASQNNILQYIDFKYRKETRRKTTITFVKKEMLEKISKQANQASYEYKRNCDRLEKIEKNRFSMDTRYLKLSTIQSFKGWEAPTIICIIQNDTFNNENIIISPELIYTGITRAKENLLVINLGENRFHDFFNSQLQLI